MNLPPFWRRASFSVAETAEIIGVNEDCLRGWLARLPTNDFAGLKQANRVWLSGQDAFFFAMLSTFTIWGLPVREAMQRAGDLVNDMDDGPTVSAVTVTSSAGAKHFEPWVLEEYGPTPRLVIPVDELFRDHLERCAAVYDREAR
jgi:hypothetical protein